MQNYGDNFIPVIPTDAIEHTADHPFCWDETCYCHENEENIAQVNEAYQEGRISADDATRIVRGQTF